MVTESHPPSAPSRPRRLLEVCVDSIEGAHAAQEGGAGRLELCAALSEGGLTPSQGLLDAVLENVCLPVHVLVRPRGGDFLYTPRELDVLWRDLQRVREAGAQGVVLGVLQPDARVDTGTLASLVAEARPLSVTFHRAFDWARDLPEALEDLILCGVDRVLTSGGEATAAEGAAQIGRLVQAARGRLGILAGGGLNEATLPALLQLAGVTEVHASASSWKESAMLHRKERCRLGAGEEGGGFGFRSTDPERVRALVRALEK